MARHLQGPRTAVVSRKGAAEADAGHALQGHRAAEAAAAAAVVPPLQAAVGPGEAEAGAAAAAKGEGAVGHRETPAVEAGAALEVGGDRAAERQAIQADAAAQPQGQLARAGTQDKVAEPLGTCNRDVEWGIAPVGNGAAAPVEGQGRADGSERLVEDHAGAAAALQRQAGQGATAAAALQTQPAPGTRLGAASNHFGADHQHAIEAIEVGLGAATAAAQAQGQVVPSQHQLVHRHVAAVAEPEGLVAAAFERQLAAEVHQVVHSEADGSAQAPLAGHQFQRPPAASGRDGGAQTTATGVDGQGDPLGLEANPVEPRQGQGAFQVQAQGSWSTLAQQHRPAEVGEARAQAAEPHGQAAVVHGNADLAQASAVGRNRLLHGQGEIGVQAAYPRKQQLASGDLDLVLGAGLVDRQRDGRAVGTGVEGDAAVDLPPQGRGRQQGLAAEAGAPAEAHQAQRSTPLQGIAAGAQGRWPQ